MGQVGQRKGIGYLLEAMGRLSRDAAVLRVVGAPIGPPSILASACGDRVQITGRLAEAELPEAYQFADVFVLPSLVEGFGLVLLEAMATALSRLRPS